jgi:hypothetical protein
MSEPRRPNTNKGDQHPGWLRYIVTTLVIAAAAGLRLWPNAQVGQGATFYFTLEGAS